MLKALARSRLAAAVLMLWLLAACAAGAENATTTPAMSAGTPIINALPSYAFPDAIDTSQSYMFYLHGKIIEDQGLIAISPDYGEYEYTAILEKLASHGFVVISEPRPKDTDAAYYAARVSEQIALLTQAGVPPERITVIGASKGAAIAVLVSNLVKDSRVNYILLGYCAVDTLKELEQNQVVLHGNVLAIRDISDELSGSCQELFDASEGKGLGDRHEIVLDVGTGHGILYHPLDEWILPAVQWAQGRLDEPLTSDQQATLLSLEQVDDYPLYTLHYVGSYAGRTSTYQVESPSSMVASAAYCGMAWGCSLFAALGDEEDRQYGRNFDWRFSPALLLFTEPADGYASVSIVDLEYLGFDAAELRHLEALSLEELRPLLQSPGLPFDGMNARGIAIGMAAVPEQDMPNDPGKVTLDQLQIMREILDHAASVDEAVHIFETYNIDMGSVPVHYLVASASGESGLVEFYQGEMKVFRNEYPWQVATNFLYASVGGQPRGQCWRYDLISRELEEIQGRLSSGAALDLLQQSSQDNTQWSVVYHMSSGEVDIVMGREYSQTVHHFTLP